MLFSLDTYFRLFLRQNLELLIQGEYHLPNGNGTAEPTAYEGTEKRCVYMSQISLAVTVPFVQIINENLHLLLPVVYGLIYLSISKEAAGMPKEGAERIVKLDIHKRNELMEK